MTSCTCTALDIAGIVVEEKKCTMSLRMYCLLTQGLVGGPGPGWWPKAWLVGKGLVGGPRPGWWAKAWFVAQGLVDGQRSGWWAKARFRPDWLSKALSFRTHRTLVGMFVMQDRKLYGFSFLDDDNIFRRFGF